MESPISGSMKTSSGGGGDHDELDSFPAARFLPSFLTLPPPPSIYPLFDPIVSYLGNSSELAGSATWAPTLYHQYSHPHTPPQLAATSPSVSGAGSSSSSPQPAATFRGPKKRSRASQRAPTTVLTTDTSNFRAMVQEFTGIPLPPFANSSFSRPRLDLFHAFSPSYLLRPIVQKPQNQGSSFPSNPHSPSSQFADPIATAINSINNGHLPSSFTSTIPLKDPNPSNNLVNHWPVNGAVLESVVAGESVNIAFESDHSESAVQPYRGEKMPAAKGLPAAIASGKGGFDSWFLSSD